MNAKLLMKLICVLLISQTLCGNQILFAATTQKSVYNKSQGNLEAAGSKDKTVIHREIQSGEKGFKDDPVEDDDSDRNVNVSDVQEFQTQSDEDGVKLVPVMRQEPTHSTTQVVSRSQARSTATPTPHSAPTTTPTAQRLPLTHDSTLVPISADSLLEMMASIGIRPIGTPAMNATSSPPVATEVTNQNTILVTTAQVAIQPGESPQVKVLLFDTSYQPIALEEVLLVTDDQQVILSTTDAAGHAYFDLSPEMAVGDHSLNFVFAGDEELLPSTAESILHYHLESPGSNGRPAQNPGEIRLSMPASVVANPQGTESDDRASVASPKKIWQAVWGIFAQLPSHLHAATILATVQMAVQTGNRLTLLGLALLGVMATPVLWNRRQRFASVAARQSLPWQWNGSFSLPMSLWYAIRIFSVGCAVAMAIVLFVRPERGLFIFWRLFIPFVPLLFFIAPGLWRNLCPMATLNQAPRLFRFTQAWTTPKWMQRYGYLIAITLFLILVTSRKIIFNQNGPALAILILSSLSAAFLMGNFFRGKSGWCSSICPLLPIQRIYGQTPFVLVNHAHCEPCLGCTRNCYDLNPKNAYLADLYDEDRQFAGIRKAFVGLFPGFVLAFYLLPNPPAISIWLMVAGFAVAAGSSLLSFFIVEQLTGASSNKITVLYGAAALNAYYWFNSLGLGSLVANPAPGLIVWGLRTLVFGLTLFWIFRTWQKEQTFIELTVAPQTFRSEFRRQSGEVTSGKSAGASGDSEHVDSEHTVPASPKVIIAPEGTLITVEHNRTLLEIIENHNLPIESGCRMGLCGADPVCVHEGMENLSKVGSDERNTLERLALPHNTRMACMARVRGDVKIDLKPAKPDIYQSSIVAGFDYDKSVKRVIIVGNGIAGVTAADHVRRRHPHCEVHLIGRERHHLYNRMGIARLIYGRSAMQGLYLLPDQWYEDFNITCWLNTQGTAINRQEREVILGTGDRLFYDRLILTTGSQSFVPPIAGFGLTGTFVLRSADDAMAIRAYAQEHRVQQAVVAGGGLLGLEAGYALRKLGLRVTILERSGALLARQLDARSAEFLKAHLESLGIAVLLNAEADLVLDSTDGTGRIQQVQLKNGRRLQADLLLVAAGIAPDIELARASGLTVNRAVVVDAQMRTSDPYIFAAGDVAEFDEKIYGLWPVAVSQAEVAAIAAVAGPGVSLVNYVESAPVTMLKVAGIDVMSIGRIHAESPTEEEIIVADESARRYRKLVIEEGKIVGAILLNAAEDAPGVTQAVKQHLDLSRNLNDLRAEKWNVLRELA